MNTWTKNCPKCRRIQIYSSKDGLNIAIKNNVRCKSCVKFGIGLGRKFTVEHRNKLSESHKGKQCGSNNGMYGKHFKHMPSAIRKISLASKGKIISEEQRRLQSEFMSGEDNPMKHLSPEQKLKRRIAFLHRKEKLGIPACIDRGAGELLNQLNSVGFNFKPKRFMEIGYEADGYDENRHIWLEYDSPYHSSQRQKSKDLIREKNIINYFETIGKPLVGFVRVNHDLTTICKYKRKVD
jgi:hypothetical protein